MTLTTQDTTNLSLIIDPGGTGSRPGINLRVYPSGSEPLRIPSGVAPERTASSSLIAGGFADIQEYEWDCVLEYTDYMKLKALINWQDVAKQDLTPFEIVIYNLVEPYTEIATSRSRFIVPGTSIITQEDLGSGYFNWVYWIAVQGILVIDSVAQAGQCFKLSLSFYEGTKLTSADE